MLHNDWKDDEKQHGVSLKEVLVFYDDSLNGVTRGVLATE
jgi:hypothetical protein